jgi:arginase
VEGGGTTSVEAFASEFPLDVARRGYAVGSIVLEAVLPPDDLRETTRPLLEWVSATGCSRVAIHFDVDTIDSNEILLGLGPERNGLTSAEVRGIIADIDGVVDVVALTIAEFIPRQVMHLQQLLSGFPLIAEP